MINITKGKKHNNRAGPSFKKIAFELYEIASKKLAEKK
jgi:hypothetical protein